MMPKHRILIIDDEINTGRILTVRLQQAGYEVLTAVTGREGLESVFAKKPDLVVLDLILPDIDGFDVCKELRQDPRSRDIPIIMLTARTESTDEVVGLEIGADDYMRKPYNSNVLVTRIKLLLKKHSGSATGKTGILKTGFLTMDPVRQKVFVEEAEVKLTTTQFKILYFLMQNPGSLFTREQVLNGAWKGRTGITARSVDVHLNGIRKRLKTAGSYIETVRGAGYRLKEFS